MTLGSTKRERMAQRADKWWKSIYLKQMQMMDRGQVRERSEPLEIIGNIDNREPAVSYSSRPSADTTNDNEHEPTDGRSVTNQRRLTR